MAVNRTGVGARCGVRPGDQPTPGLWSSGAPARKGRLLCMFLEVPAGSKACLPCAGFWGLRRQHCGLRGTRGMRQCPVASRSRAENEPPVGSLMSGLRTIAGTGSLISAPVSRTAQNGKAVAAAARRDIKESVSQSDSPSGSGIPLSPWRCGRGHGSHTLGLAEPPAQGRQKKAEVRPGWPGTGQLTRTLLCRGGRWWPVGVRGDGSKGSGFVPELDQR